MSAPQPAVGQVMTVFRSRLRTEAAEAYATHAARISELARAMPGYVEHKVFTAEDGERVTVVRFADEATHEAWARDPDHREAQRAGVATYYDEWSIAVGRVERGHAWRRDPGDIG
jgi:heme-degrading monooxygenase HmoA